MDELRIRLQHRDQAQQRAEKQQRRGEHQAPLGAHQRGKAGEQEFEHALRLAAAVAVERVVAAQRELVQPVDQLRAVLAVRGEREALADTAIARRHLLRGEWGFLGVFQESFKFLPFLGVPFLELVLPHLRPAM